jgi:AcrR family transcriptional regulator
VARPRSDDRRFALLEAATKVFAEHGLAAPTALIAKTAAVSNGSFFTYFATKDELIDALYRELRLDLATAVTSDFPRKANIRARLEHVFRRYVRWGGQNPLARKALRQIAMSPAITPEVRAEGRDLFADIERLHADAVAQRTLQVPPIVVGQTLKALAEMTIELCAQHPERADELEAVGFRMLWAALSSKP